MAIYTNLENGDMVTVSIDGNGFNFYTAIIPEPIQESIHDPITLKSVNGKSPKTIFIQIFKNATNPAKHHG